MKTLARFLLWFSGWKVQGSLDHLDKCVVIGAPHTTNWDFFYGLLFKMYHGLSIRFLMKKELFSFPMGYLLKILGGIPVDRTKSTRLVDKMAGEIKNSSHYVLALTPEGTRKRVNSWKMGFYYIAKKAEVPIVLGFLDYQQRIVGVGPIVEPGEDMQKDLDFIINFYSTIKAKYPEKFSLPSRI
jgi:1-acyl-sn-glycerol-3-phosphate acyltransferase